MRTFTQPIFSFLLLISLCLFVNQDVRAQWELLLKQEGQNWQYQDMQVGGDGGVLIIAQVENSYRLLRVNILGQVVWGFAFEELNLPDIEIINPTVQILTDGNLLLSYGTDSLETHKRLAKLNPYGKLIWMSDLEFYGAVIEMESGDYLQIVSVEVENVSEEEERDIVATAISRENGSILWREVYATEADEEIWKRKWTSDGNYMIAGKSDENHIFTMLFSDEGEHIGGYTYDFEGEELDIPEGNDGYQLSDIDITSDDGLIVMRIYKMKSSSHVYLYPYLTVEKFDRVGEVEWSNTYGYDLEDNYSFWSSYKHYIRQNFQNDYVIYGNFIVNGAQNIGTGKISQEGFFLWEEYYTNLAYNNPFSSTFTYLEPLETGGYLLFGYERLSFASKIPFAAKIDDTGKLKWGEFYDLGDENQNNLFFAPKANRCYNSQLCYTASDVTNIHTEEDFIYIFSVDENGLKYENIINGEVFLDSNEDCDRDESDNGLYSGIVVTIDSPQFTRYSFTDKNGRFSTELPINDYTISYSLDNELFAPSCNTNSYQISFTENYDTLTNLNFPLQAIVECPKLEVEIGTPLLRRCFKNTYKVSYCNKGTLAAEDAKITLEFPDEMIPLESSIEPALKEGQQWTFDLGKMDIGECGFFTVIDSVSCEVELGSTICLKSRILPDDPCEAPNPLWDGSHIEVTGECLGEQVRFTLENVGSGNMSEERNFSVYENNVLTETGKIQLKSHERLQLHLNPNGKALRLKVEQSPHFPINEDEPQTTVEACGAGNYSYGYINSTEQNDRPPSIDIDCQEIIGSFDPNDIQVYPTGITNQHFIEENTKLTYKIRFQNTGNDTAFRVMIVDTLPQGLEGASLNLGNSSHDYTFDIKFGNLLVWTFDNILLPDSTTNELESHGFVQYSILPKADIELGAKIENKADIYFDFNAPVATNQVFNTIAEDLDLDYGTPLSLYILFIDFNTELLDNGNIKVDWVAINSNHISHFEVERSRNPYSFEMIQKVAPKKGENDAYLYEFEDKYEGNESVLYYRIKAIGVTGDYDYTLIRVVLLENNPAKYEVSSADKKQLLIEWIGERDETYTIRVFNTIGQQILDFNVSWFDSLMPHLDRGVYILQVFDSQDRMIKTKKVFGL